VTESFELQRLELGGSEEQIPQTVKFTEKRYNSLDLFGRSAPACKAGALAGLRRSLFLWACQRRRRAEQVYDFS
jgi:hypothetical protein